MADVHTAIRPLPNPTLADILANKHNNFDLVRLIAAVGVIYFHAFSVQGATGDDRIYAFLHPDSTGSLAVYAFFLVSGMLISKSAETQRSLPVFLTHRVLRIWPGMIFYLLVAFCILIPVGSHISLQALFAIRWTASCIADNLVLVYGACIAVPGIFETNKVTEMFGAPLWSLQPELYCYGLVLFYSAISSCRFSDTQAQRRNFCLYVLFVLAGFIFLVWNPPSDWHLSTPFVKKGGYSSYPVLFFLAGMVMYTYRAFIRMDGRVAIGLVVLYVCFPENKLLLYTALLYAVPAFAGSPAFASWKPPHDYSFGLYIYGFTVQQVVANMLPTIDGISNFLISVPLSLVFSAISWHLVEKPSLAFGKKLTPYMRAVTPAFVRERPERQSGREERVSQG